ncbi:DEAD/DEAH box helicase family protein [Caldibacillus thermolactis]|uniref:DEAD/DEAH box helicase family protein n=2 Tax=Pallidibacillus TaxID=3034002 RepID=A0ABT2WHV4_9BACI|nr:MULTISPECIES: DEAD/DEAH box helicase family protein [Bacillaceae]MBU5343504.1 DEAD/DEAH box helicase family protein [Caldifermentibacillus hisashii]MCU9594541.1 DEAD/DEAH box helicase family protein [Pallidibacillus thermolactis]
MNRFVKQISSRLSLRDPQRESLEILAEVVDNISLEKNTSSEQVQRKLNIIKNLFPSVEDFEREFPSICFALATGVGKTRLMGAFISYLYMAKGIKNYFVLAPNLTIYEKLIQDFTPNTKKYVFKGISQFATKEPLIITGENYEESAIWLLDPDTVKINIFNISKINTEVRGGNSPRIKRLSEYLGESYFDYLSSLPDLVLLMDESHRYRASAGVKAINELNPVLGLELTATPQVEKGQRTIPFKNVIYSFPLYMAMEKGYVKEPTVATRENFDASNYSEDELEQLKISDGILVHEETKVELEVYARENNLPVVKPFILIVAQDTDHAENLLNIIKSDEFFEGKYKDKVITVHSKQSGEEKDETIQELLALEAPNSNTEIVIHVNKLKEGWDVTNLYTIIPLRAANSKTLVEQSIGRGLRLPYGKRTGVKAVDRLTIIAHDRFQEIIDEANNPNSVIRKGVYIGKDVAKSKKKVVSVESNVKQSIIQKIAGDDINKDDENAKQRMEIKRNIVQTTFKTIQNLNHIQTNKHLTKPEIKQQIIKEIKTLYPTGQMELVFEDETNVVEEIVETVTDYIVEKTIDIPKIILQPKSEISWDFEDFDLDVSNINLQPVTQDILLQELRTRQRDTLHFKVEVNENEPLENYIISRLIDFDDISYEEHADLLYKLVNQLIAHLKSYLKDDNDVRNVLLYNQQLLANNIHAQMLDHYVESKVEYDVHVRSDFEVLKTNTYSMNIDEEVKDFRIPVENPSSIKGMSFGGFSRCLYPIQKFDAENERRFAVICEQDPKVKVWFKPALNQLKIYYNQKQSYNPDFIVETEDKKYLVELKAANKIDSDKEVEAKKHAAIEWCKYATKHEMQNGGKEWVYLLIPHNDVNENMTIAGLEARYSRK